MKRLAIVITHPIQYYVPVFQLLAKQCQLKVFYTWGEAGIKAKHDPGFGKTIAWDMPLLEGYDYEVLSNTAADPGSHHGKGIVNPDLIEKLQPFAPDAILIYGYIYDSHFKAMRHFKGNIPIWFRGDSTLLDLLLWYKAIAKKLYLNWVYSYVDKAFYVGSNNKAYFKKYGLKEEQLVFAPHAIDNERFSIPRTAEVVALRQSLNIAPEDIVILFAGKLEPKKNPELLLEAFLELTNKQQPTTNNEKRTGVHLLFVGNGVLESSLKSQSDSYRLSHLTSQIQTTNNQQPTTNIHFLDFQNQSQMPVVYQACDVFCLPSAGPGESWGLAINEAMAAGKAVIASDQVGCAVDLIEEGGNGYIFTSGNSKALTKKLTLLLENTSEISRFGQHSAKIIDHWTFKQQVKSILQQLNELR